MLPPKICPMCKEKVIEGWESACQSCWNRVVEHDLCPICRGATTTTQTNGNAGITHIVKCPECAGTGWTGIWRATMIIFNDVREFCRKCGFDPVVEIHF